MEMIDVLKRLEQISHRSPEDINRAISNASKLAPHTGAVKEGILQNNASNSAQMIDVLSKLREISGRSPGEVGRAIDSVAKLNNIPVAEGVKVDLTGEDAVLGQILKLAGMINAETSMNMASPDVPAIPGMGTPAVPSIGGPSTPSISSPIGKPSISSPSISSPIGKPAVATAPVGSIGGSEPHGMEVTMDDAPVGGKGGDRPFNNSPHEIYKGPRAAVPSGDDLAKPKANYMGQKGDNLMKQNATHVAVDFD